MAHSRVSSPALVPDWVQEAVFYQIFPDRFCRSTASRQTSTLPFQPWGTQPDQLGFQGGDLRGILEKLDYLEDLGVTALYLNPIFVSAANHRYHTCDYYQVDPLLGGNQAFRELLDAVHARGMRLILDGVFNHVGRGFWAFHHVLENQQQSLYTDWFHIHGFPVRPYTEAHGNECNYDAWWGLPGLPKLNHDNPAVRAYLLNVARYWIEFGIDGWRLDVPEEITEPSFWPDFRRVVRQANPEAYIVGEIWGSGQGWLSGDRFDGITNYAFGRAALGFLAHDALPPQPFSISGHEIRRLDAVSFAEQIETMVRLHEWRYVLSNLNYLDSHDMPRIMHLAGADVTAVKLMQGLQMAMPGVPVVYYGTEIGLAGGPDPDCRRAYPWDDSDAWHHDLRAHCQWLIQTRKQHMVLRRGRYAQLLAAGQVFAFKRFLHRELAYVVLNADTVPVTLTLEDPYGDPDSFVLVDAADGSTVYSAQGRTEGIRVAPRSLRLLIRQPV